MNNRTYGNNLFFFVGNSGSGKDSLMKSAAQKLENMGNSVFIVKRYITRSNHSSEEYFSISKEEFVRMKNENIFALDWSIYDLYYGCPKIFEEKLKDGHIVFINVSRSVLNECKKNFPNSKIIFLKVPIEIAKQRLLQRGRETGKALQKRLDRMKENITIPFQCIEIESNNKLEKTVEILVSKIIREIHH